MSERTADIVQPTVEPTTTDEIAEACPECSGRVLRDGHEDVCEDCGLVVDDDYLDLGPDWQSFDSGGVRGMQRAPYSPTTKDVHDDGLGSHVGFENASPKTWGGSKMMQLQSENIRTRLTVGTEAERFAIGEVRRLCGSLEISKRTRERAAAIVRDIRKAGLFVGRDAESAAGAAVVIAVRESPETVPTSDIARLLRLDEDAEPERRLMRFVKAAKRELGIALSIDEPEGYVAGAISRLGASSDVEARALELIDSVDGTTLAGGSPRAVAAGAIYLAAEEIQPYLLTQTEIAEDMDVSANTIRSWARTFCGEEVDFR